MNSDIKPGDIVVYRDHEKDLWSDNKAVYLGYDDTNPYYAGPHLIRIIGAVYMDQTKFVKKVSEKFGS
jgi:hypothetical protein